MPELPEVQTVIEGIKPKILNKKILDFKKYVSKLRYPISASIRNSINGKLVKGLYRRAKYIIIDLEGNVSIVIHLGMSGRIIILKSEDNQLFSFPQMVLANLSYIVSSIDECQLT